jgi:SPP1 gp7 family putative phage head morphogenesis protein
MVAEVTAETRRAIRAIVLRSIREGIPPYDAARLIHSLIGLTERQAQAAANYRASLIDQGLTIARVNTLVDRYVAKKVRERAESIARTEILSALNEGAQESWRQARAEGLLGKGSDKEWIVTPDERLCPYCEPLDGVRVPLDEKFRTGLGEVSGPPLHPQCRCTIAVESSP